MSRPPHAHNPLRHILVLRHDALALNAASQLPDARVEPVESFHSLPAPPPDAHHVPVVLMDAQIAPKHLPLPDDVPLIALAHQDAQALNAAAAGAADVVLLPAKPLEISLRIRITLARDAFAAQDPLTGLQNRRRLHSQIRRELSSSKKHQQHCGAVLSDMDGFKILNDKLGHHAGDVALVAAAKLFQKRLSHERSWRLGGDEFFGLVPCSSPAALLKLADELRRDVAQQSLLCNNSPFHVTLSIGAAFWNQVDPPETLMARADHALRLAKAKGGDNAAPAPRS